MHLPQETVVQETFVQETSNDLYEYDRKKEMEKIKNKQELLNFIKKEMFVNSVDLSNFEPLFTKFKCCVSEIISLSHIFCTLCSLNKEDKINTPIQTWCEENPEYFETDIFYLHHLFLKYPIIYEDIEAYEVGFFEDKTNQDNLMKKIYTIITYYDMFQR